MMLTVMKEIWILIGLVLSATVLFIVFIIGLYIITQVIRGLIDKNEE